MRKVKKLASVLLAVALMLAMNVTAFAITINVEDGNVTGATYVAYKLMDVTVGSTKDGETYSYTVNSKYSAVLQSATNQTSDENVISYLQTLTSRSTEMNEIAEAIYSAIGNKNLQPEATTTSGAFTNVDAGYYLIVETEVGTLTSGTTDTYSIYMLDTAADEPTTVETKESVPSLTKKSKRRMTVFIHQTVCGRTARTTTSAMKSPSS